MVFERILKDQFKAGKEEGKAEGKVELIMEFLGRLGSVPEALKNSPENLKFCLN